MANFAPNGFQQKQSWSSSALAQAGVFEFSYPSFLHGFAGDVATTTPLNNAGDWIGALALPIDTSAIGYVFPYAVTPDATYNFQPIIGVIVGFRYQPANQNGIVVQSSNFIMDTPLKANTGVTALVQTDIQNIYKVQVGGVAGNTSGIQQTQLFNAFPIKADVTYKSSNALLSTFDYALGNTSNGGQSRMYIDNSAINTHLGPVTEALLPVNLVGIAAGSSWSTTSPLYTETNPFVLIRLQSSLWQTANPYITV